MKSTVSFVLILVLALAGTASALEVNMLSEKYYIKVNYKADGLDPAFYDPTTGYTGVNAVWEDSFEKKSDRGVLSHEIEFVYPGGFASSTFAYAETGRFEVYATARAGPTGYEWTDDAGVTTYVDFSKANFLSEATWKFRLTRVGFQILRIYYSGDTDYWDSLDDKSMYVSLFRNGTMIYSEYLFSTPIIVDGTRNLLLFGNRLDVWELRIKLAGSAWDNDCLRCDVATNLTATPLVLRPSSLTLEE